MTNQIVIMELPCHILVIATSYDVKILWHFCPTWHIYSNSSTWFCDVFWYWLWQKWASQISDDRIIVTRFMTKKYIFVAEDLLWHGIGNEPIFVMQTSQIIKHDENMTSICVVVFILLVTYKVWSWNKQKHGIKSIFQRLPACRSPRHR